MTLLRIHRLRPVGSGAALDAAFRDEVVPALAALPGVQAVHVGRHGPDESGERALVSILDSADALAILEHSTALATFDEAYRAEIAETTIETLAVGFSVRIERPDPPVVLRIFRGEVRPGELDTYLAEAHAGTLADIGTGDGPLALYLAIQPPASFTTVSVWTSWTSIERSTGGNIRHPIATRNAHRVVRGDAAHYEILTATVPVSSPAPRVALASG